MATSPSLMTLSSVLTSGEDPNSEDIERVSIAKGWHFEYSL